MDYMKLYSEKLRTVDEALALVKSGETVVLGGDCNCPKLFAYSLHKIAPRVENVSVFKDHTNPCEFATADGMRGHINTLAFFYGRDSIEGARKGNCTFFPTDLCNYSSFLTEKHGIDVFAVAATDMDENGNFQIGVCNMWEADSAKYAVEHKAVIIVEANKNIPRVRGGFELNVKDVTCVIKADYQMGEVPVAVPNEVEKKVAQNVRSLMRDGDCVQFGIGSLPDAIASQCMDLCDLGLHTEMITTALGKMIRAGVITGERKNFNPGEHLFTFAGGDRALYETIAANPKCRIVPASYGVNPMVIMKNDNMVSVNTLIEMDLTGQVCSESVGYRQQSGSGGAFDYAYGALMSKGGRGIMAFTSKTKKGDSKIKGVLAPGAAVTVLRNYVDYIVTEYGIAQMRGRDVRTRANNLIAIAHPDFREELRAEARKMLYI